MLSRGVKIRQLYQFQGISCFQHFHSDPYGNLFFDIESNGLKSTRLLQYTPILTVISYLYNAELTKISKRNSQGRPVSSNFPPATEIGDYIYYVTTANDVSSIKMTPTIK